MDHSIGVEGGYDCGGKVNRTRDLRSDYARMAPASEGRGRSIQVVRSFVALSHFMRGVRQRFQPCLRCLRNCCN